MLHNYTLAITRNSADLKLVAKGKVVAVQRFEPRGNISCTQRLCASSVHRNLNIYNLTGQIVKLMSFDLEVPHPINIFTITHGAPSHCFIIKYNITINKHHRIFVLFETKEEKLSSSNCKCANYVTATLNLKYLL